MNTKESRPQEGADGLHSRWMWLLGTGCLLIILVSVLFPRAKDNPAGKPASGPVWVASVPTASIQADRVRDIVRRKEVSASTTATAQEIVAVKVTQFARNRLDLARKMAARAKVELTPEIAQFFTAVQAGDWAQVTNSFHALWEQRKFGGGSNDDKAEVQHFRGPDRVWTEQSNDSLKAVWSTIMETYGVAEQAHEWPAQKLLDYGNAILGSLRPGMVYVGGTDSGRFIPTLLNETSDDEHHIVLTQNALADNTYLDYVRFQYGDQLQMLSGDDGQRAFEEYITDAQKRLLHDQQFPDEPKQVKPGEDIQMNDGRIQISGQVAVMLINEKLMQFLMAKNPDTSFAMEQSFPLTSTYAAASTLGPIMELRVNDEQNALTADRASQAVDYWRFTAQQLLSDAEGADSRNVRMTWSKMADEQASLFLDYKYAAQADEAFQIANDLCPWSPESVFRYVNFLLSQNRPEDALRIAENGAKADPENRQFRDLAEHLRSLPH